MRVLLDVDCGIDDALAILLAVASPECELAAVTTVCGNTDVEGATRNAAGVLGLALAGDVETGAVLSKKVPILARGAEAPLTGAWRRAAEFHGPDGLAGLSAELVGRGVETCGLAADELIVRQARERGLHIVTTGPLTNLALALRKEPGLPRMVESVTVMGGAYTVGGNETADAEYNMWVDPVAAGHVFAAGFNLTAVGLDVSMKTRLGKEDLPARPVGPGRSVRPMAVLARRLAVYYMSREAAQTGAQGAYLHDPLALGVAVGLATVTKSARGAVTVDTEGECKGRTLMGEYPDAPTEICLGVDSEAFVGLFRDRVLAP